MELFKKLEVDHDVLVDQIIAKKRKVSGKFQLDSAYVVYLNQSDKIDIQCHYLQYEKDTNCFNKYVCCCKKKATADSSLVLDDKIIQVSAAENPGDILYENIGMSSGNRCFRLFISLIFVLLMICVFTLLVFTISNLLKENFDCDKSISYKGICLGDPSVCSSNLDTMKCFCKELTYNEATGKYAVDCRDIYWTDLLRYSNVFLIAFIIFITNLLLRIVVGSITVFCRFKTMPQNIVFNTVCLFLAITVNTFMLTYIIYIKVYWEDCASKDIGNEHTISYLFTKFYGLFGFETEEVILEVFSGDWYRIVGLQLILTRVFEIIFLQWFVYLYRVCVKNRAYKQCMEKPMTVYEIRKKLDPYGFDFSWNYARICISIFLTLAFSTSIPLLIV